MINSGDLGKIVVVYRDRPLRWQDLGLIIIPAVLLVLAPWVYGLYRVSYANAKYGPAAARIWGTPWFRLAAALLIPLLILGLSLIWRARRGVILHQGGLRIQRPLRRAMVLRWPHIEGIACAQTLEKFLGLQLATRCKVTLYPTRGKPIHISPKLKQIDELAARLKAKIYPRLLPALSTDLQAGKRLYFGPIQIDRQQLIVRGKKIPWDQVALLNLHKGHLVIQFQNNRQRKIPVSQIPNIELLIQLIQKGVEV